MILWCQSTYCPTKKKFDVGWVIDEINYTAFMLLYDFTLLRMHQVNIGQCKEPFSPNFRVFT